MYAKMQDISYINNIAHTPYIQQFRIYPICRVLRIYVVSLNPVNTHVVSSVNQINTVIQLVIFFCLHFDVPKNIR